jgi:hypothetical protein
MAIAKPIIYTGISIADAGGANAATFDLHLVESAEVTPEPVTSMVDDGQTLTDYYDVTFAVNLYEMSVLSDARVYSDGSAEPIKADITFTGATGADDLTLSGVIINGTQTYDGNRTQARLHGSKRSVKISDSITQA